MCAAIIMLWLAFWRVVVTSQWCRKPS